MAAIGDLVHETTASTGTGNLTLAAVSGKRGFADVFGTVGSNVFHYFISNRSAAEWERGTGSMSDATTLVRDTVVASSNSNNAVNFSAGTKDVVNDLPSANQLDKSTVSANGLSLITAADYAAMRALLDLEAGTDFLSPGAIAAAYQPLDGDLTSWAGVTRASGFDTFAATPSGANFKALLSDDPLDSDIGGTGNAFTKFSGPGTSEKTFTLPNLSASVHTDKAGSADEVFALTDGATPALDASLGNVFTLAAAGDRTIAVPSNPLDGQKIIIRHLASGGARTLALNTGTGGFRYGTDITGLTQTASGKTDYIGAIYHTTDNKWDVVAYIKGF